LQLVFVAYLFAVLLVPDQACRQSNKLPDTPLVRETMDSIYNYSFFSARALVNRVNYDSKESLPIGALLEVFLLRWQYVPVAFSNESTSYLKLLETIEQRLKQENELINISYLRVSAFLLLSEYYNSVGNSLQSLRFARKAYPQVIRCLDSNTPSLEDDFIRGLYLYYREYYANKNIFYKSALWPLRNGDKETGLKLLAKVAGKPSMVKTEAAIFSAHILLRLENSPSKALSFSSRLVSQYPNNLKFLELYIENLLACKRYEEAALLIPRLACHHNPYVQCAGKLFEGILEEEFNHNPSKALRCYKIALKTGSQKIKSIELFHQEAEIRRSRLEKHSANF